MEVMFIMLTPEIKAGKEMLLNYGRQHSAGRVEPEEARKILKKLSFPITKRVRS